MSSRRSAGDGMRGLVGGRKNGPKGENRALRSRGAEDRPGAALAPTRHAGATTGTGTPAHTPGRWRCRGGPRIACGAPAPWSVRPAGLRSLPAGRHPDSTVARPPSRITRSGRSSSRSSSPRSSASSTTNPSEEWFVAVVTTVWSSEGDVTGPIGHMARQAENPVAKTSKRAAGNHMTCTLPGGTSGGQATAAAAPCESDTLGRAPNGEGTARKNDLSSAAFGWNPWCGGLPVRAALTCGRLHGDSLLESAKCDSLTKADLLHIHDSIGRGRTSGIPRP